jgi:hypothetical protein
VLCCAISTVLHCTAYGVDSVAREVQCGTASTLTVSEVHGTCHLSREVSTYAVYSGREE